MSLEQGYNGTSGLSLLDRSLDLYDRAKALGFSFERILARRLPWRIMLDGRELVACRHLDEVEAWLEHMEREHAGTDL